MVVLAGAFSGALVGWGEEAPPAAPITAWDCMMGRTPEWPRPTADEIQACLDHYNLSLTPPWREQADPTKAPPEWDLLDKRQACQVYMAWDPELEDCVRTAEPLPPELEWYARLNRPLVRPPDGVLVLHKDESWSAAPRCPPELTEEQHVNGWRFCRDPQDHVMVPRLWNPPINGIPYVEAEAILEKHRATLQALPGVTAIGLGPQSIEVHTAQPAVVPTEIGGLPILTLPPEYSYRLSHTDAAPERPLPGAVSIGVPWRPGTFMQGPGRGSINPIWTYGSKRYTSPECRPSAHAAISPPPASYERWVGGPVGRIKSGSKACSVG